MKALSSLKIIRWGRKGLPENQHVPSGCDNPRILKTKWLKGPELNLMIGYLCKIWTVLTMILSPQCVLKIVSMAIYIVLSKLFFMPFSPLSRYLWGTYHLSISFLNKSSGGKREYFLEEMKDLTLVKKSPICEITQSLRLSAECLGSMLHPGGRGRKPWCTSLSPMMSSQESNLF